MDMEHIKPSTMSMCSSDNLIPELPQTTYSYGQHRLVTAWFRSPWQDIYFVASKSTLSVTMELLLLRSKIELLQRN